MNGRSRMSQLVRWALAVSMTGLLPAFVLRCDKAALNFQRGLMQGLGFELSEALAEQVQVGGDSEDDSNDED